MSSRIPSGGPLGPRFGRVGSGGKHYGMRNRSFCHELPNGGYIAVYLPALFDASSLGLQYALRLVTGVNSVGLDHMVAYKVSGEVLARFSGGLELYCDLPKRIADAFGQTDRFSDYEEDLTRFLQTNVFLDTIKVFFKAMSANFELGEGEKKILRFLEKSHSALRKAVEQRAHAQADGLDFIKATLSSDDELVVRFGLEMIDTTTSASLQSDLERIFKSVLYSMEIRESASRFIIV